ncbi:MAG: ribonuclease D [Flavobacteriales bacterium]
MAALKTFTEHTPSMSWSHITSTAELSTLMAELRREPVLAIDTEASSFHHYHERICLIQLSTRTATWLVDPLTVTDMTPLVEALADPAIEWVIHDADFDLRMLKKMWNARVTRVFDTFVAAELLNEPELGLAALLGKYFGLKVDKRFQKADWGKRPLSAEMLAYAAMDTTYLIALRDILSNGLEAKGRTEWAAEEFAHLVHIPFETPENDEPGFLRMKGAKALKPRQLAVLRALHAWREPLAEKLDRAPFMVLGNDVLLELSRNPPTSLDDFASRKGVGATVVQRNGREIMRAVEEAMALPKEAWPRVPRPKRWERDDDYEDRLKRLKQVRDQLMAQYELRPGVVSPNHVLGEIARTLPGDLDALGKLNGMRPWQVRVFGEALLKAL